MIHALAAALVAVATSQVAEAGTQSAVDTSRAEDVSVPTGRVPDSQDRFADPKQTGVPFQPYATPPGPERGGVTMDLGVESAFRAMSLTGSDAGDTVGLDVEVAPGLSLSVDLPSFVLAAGGAARVTIPIDSMGPGSAVLSTGYLRLAWKASPLWKLSLESSTTVGDYSQLYPVTLPGGSGPQPPVLNPVRSFATYPYFGVDATARLEYQASSRDRLRFTAGYTNVGGVGTAGEIGGAQPRSWGPSAAADWQWEASRTSSLTTSLSLVDTIMEGEFYILLATLRGTYAVRFSDDLETVFTLGVAATNTDSITFLTVAHLLPVAGAGLRYFTDVAHQFRLSLDASLSPYVDPYSRSSYQRLNFSTGLDWYPTGNLMLGLNIAAAWVPYTERAPEAYGTGGVSVAWSASTIFTIAAGAFSQAQLQGPQGGSFRQWTAYVSLTARDQIAF